MLEDTRLVSDGDHFYEVPPVPGSSPASFDVELELASTASVSTTSTHALPDVFTPTSTAPAVPLTPPPGALAPMSAEIIGPQPALSDAAARARVAAHILASLWYRSHGMEPPVDQPGVPECALQLAKSGYSIWACFFKKVRRKGLTVYKCVKCGHETHRLNRAVAHQRAEWEHKPFACTDPGW